jgi:hypothetical protein
MDFIAVPKLKIRLEVGTTGKGEQGGFLPFGIILPYQAMLGLMGGMLVFVCCCCSCMKKRWKKRTKRKREETKERAKEGRQDGPAPRDSRKGFGARGEGQ